MKTKLHIAALALVAWYLMMAPTFRNPQNRLFHDRSECTAVGIEIR
jgi:hypothetical protein